MSSQLQVAVVCCVPVNLTDPTGHRPICDNGECSKAILAAFGKASVAAAAQAAAIDAACQRSPQCSLQRQLVAFGLGLSTTQSAYKSETGCITDAIGAFWSGANYKSYSCGLLGHPHKDAVGGLSWTSADSATGKTQLACDWFGSCTILGSTVLVAGSSAVGVLSFSASATKPITLFSRGGAMTNAEAAASGTTLPRTQETVERVAGQAGIDLRGIDVHIVEGNDEIRYLDLQGACACVNPPSQIRLGPASFANEGELAASIAHEATHVAQYDRGVVEAGVGLAGLQDLEAEAEASEWVALAQMMEAEDAAAAGEAW